MLSKTLRRSAMFGRRRDIHYECVGGPLNMKGTGRSISHELLMTESYGKERMHIHPVQGYISTLYLVQYPDRGEWLLLDAGMPSDVERVKSFIAFQQQQPLSRPRPSESSEAAEPEDIASVSSPSPPPTVSDPATSSLKLVVSTHCHVDHVGSCHRWGNRGVPTATASGYERFYEGVWGKLQELVDCGLSLLVAQRLGRRFESPFSSLWYKSLSSRAKKLPSLNDGDSLPYFEDWIALKCPGHTDHMVILYHPLTQILYVADFIVAPRRFKFQAPMPVDIDYAYSHALHRFRKLPVRFALLAHGGVVDMEDVGGWEFVLDTVVENQRKKSKKAALQLIDALTRFSRAPGLFTRDMLPRGPLPATVESPPSITYIKQ